MPDADDISDGCRLRGDGAVAVGRMTIYLWINLCDLSMHDAVGLFGSFINLMIQPKLGDEQLPGAWQHRERLDDSFIVVKTSRERAKALLAAIEFVGQRKLGRKIRMRTTVKPPGKVWRWAG